MLGDFIQVLCALTVIGLALFGAFVLAVLVYDWFDDESADARSTARDPLLRAERDADDEIFMLKQQAISDMFDHARAVRLQRRIGGEK